ncbi:WhiB family transcriptional regulator [Rhodococcus sp. NPDC058532]|uniref:WhiB family transcriptional regulator n=1 Tax=Rhodococcus sp. NPDC058532 TaxID=3346540 RepID=UPI00366A3F93
MSGLCTGRDPEMWFPVGSTDTTRRAADKPIAVCRRCPARSGCARAALDLDIHTGIWAGIWLDDPEVAPSVKQAALEQVAVGIEPGELERTPVRRILRECTGPCGRMTRPHGSTIEQYPDTVRRHARGMCQPCARARSLEEVDAERAERRVVVERMTRRGIAAHRIAEHLGVTERTVQRDQKVVNA